MFECTKCQYQTNSKQLFDKHLARKTPCVKDVVAAQKHSLPFDCGKCHMGYAREAIRDAHEQKCDGVHPLQCPTCKTCFMNRFAKTRHVARADCVMVEAAPVPSAASTSGTSTIVRDSKHVNINTVNNNQHTVVNINCTPEQKDQIVSFIDTDLDAVVQLVLKDPARFQLAMLNGNLHQELCKATHFGPIDTNHNIYSIEGKGTKMRVQHNGKKCVMDKKQGLTRIINNNHKIASDGKAAQYLGKHTMKRNQASRNLISDVVQNRGEYIPVVDFYDRIPTFTAPEKYGNTLIKDVEQALMTFWNFGDYDELVPYCKKAFAHDVCHYKGQWWESIETGGWASCEDAPKVVERCIHELIDGITSNAVEMIASTDDRETRYYYKDVKDGVDVLNERRLIQIVLGSVVSTC